MSGEGSGYRCTICQRFAATTVNGVLKHIGLVHSHQPFFRVTCGVKGCPNAYSNYNSFRKHLRRKHLDDLLELRPPRDRSYAFCSLEEDIEVFQDTEEATGWNKESSTHFVLKCKEVGQMPQGVINDLLSDITLLVDHSLDTLSNNVRAALDRSDVAVEDIAGLEDVLYAGALRKPFEGLESEYFQKKAFHSLGLVHPIERVLGSSFGGASSHNRFKLISDCAYDVPLKESLQQLLSNASVFSEVMQGHQRSDGLIKDYCDGLNFAEHPLFSQDIKHLQIILYYDDVEVCNPLGSRVKKHKLGLFYYLLGNIRPELRSSLKMIQLVTLVRHTFIKDYGIDKILEPFMDSIRLLEEGMELSIHDQLYKFKGTISIVCADNLASWSLGGFKTLSSALRKCRFCMAVGEDMKSKFMSEDFERRTRECHSSHCTLLSGPSHDHIATTYGVDRDSILNNSKYFHVTEGLAPDIMHDILEGCLQYELKELLKYFICQQKLMTLSSLNKKIISFRYGPIESRNKPVPISNASLSSSDHSLKQSASQLWCLAKLIPLMIGDVITENEEHWENFLLLLTITDFVFGPVASQDVIPYLKDTIQEHHINFCKLYPHAPIIPKLHYMIHLPEWLLRFGPPSRYWCMRFEAKHSYFKSLTHKVKCFKNIAKTLAERHQNLMCYYSLDESSFKKDWEYGNIKKVIKKDEYERGDVISDTLNEIETDVSIVSWAKYGTASYKPRSFVVVKNTLLPRFGEIVDILVFNIKKCLFILQLYDTNCFLHHYHAFEVTQSQDFCSCLPNNLVDYHPLSLYALPNQKKVIPLKYHLIEDL